MPETIFVEGGTVSSDSQAYVLREADLMVLSRLRKMQYLTIAAPHLQGKTSLVFRAARILAPEGYSLVYVDLSTLIEYTQPAEWYQNLYQSMVRKLPEALKLDKARLSLPEAGPLRDFLYELAGRAEEDGVKLIVALDEAGAIPEEWATPFFTNIRSIYNEREALSRYNYITFVIYGTFNARSLIKTNYISEFNISHQINLPDFDEGQVGRLVACLELGDKAEMVARQIYDWTNGQPYLVQKLCLMLSELAERGGEIDEHSVEVQALLLIRQDDRLLPGIIRKLEERPDMLDYLLKILDYPVVIDINDNDTHFWLVKIVGILDEKPATSQLRNRIYEYRLRDYLEAKIADQETSGTGQGQAPEAGVDKPFKVRVISQYGTEIMGEKPE